MHCNRTKTRTNCLTVHMEGNSTDVEVVEIVMFSKFSVPELASQPLVSPVQVVSSLESMEPSWKRIKNLQKQMCTWLRLFSSESNSSSGSGSSQRAARGPQIFVPRLNKYLDQGGRIKKWNSWLRTPNQANSCAYQWLRTAATTLGSISYLFTLDPLNNVH